MIGKIAAVLGDLFSEEKPADEQELKRVVERAHGLIASRGAAPLSRANQMRLAEAYLNALKMLENTRKQARKLLDHIQRERDQELIDRYNAFVVGVRVGLEKTEAELDDELLQELFAGCEGDRIRATRE